MNGLEASPAITVEELTKRYGRRLAVDSLSFAVQRGEIFALLGPNGAGKTTTVEILEGYRRADGGTVRVLGSDPAARDTGLRSRVGVMLQDGGLYPAITPREALELFARLYPRPRATDELLALVGLTDSASVRYRRLSGGQKQRLSLALAMLPRPEVLFLDEPTSGLDPQARGSTWSIIESLRDEGTTILLTTHYLAEAENLADRVAIIDSGRLVALGTPDELTRSARDLVRIRVNRSLDLGLLLSLPAARDARETGTCRYDVWSNDVAGLLVQLTTALRDHHVDVIELRVGHDSLEEVFLRLTGVEGAE